MFGISFGFLALRLVLRSTVIYLPVSEGRYFWIFQAKSSHIPALESAVYRVNPSPRGCTQCRAHVNLNTLINKILQNTENGRR
jgi:hypothetical protein